MAFQQFADTQFFKVMDTSEVVHMGGASTVENAELQYVRIKLCVIGTLSGTEQIRVTLYSTSNYDGPIVSSDWSDIGDVLDENGSAVTGDWFGWIRCNFNRQQLNKNTTYYLAAETNNYTFSAGSLEFMLAYDWPVFTYGAEDQAVDNPLAFELYTYEGRDNVK